MNNLETKFDVGQRTLAPYLLKHRNKHLDAVILTNLNPEYSEGLGAITRGFNIDRFYDPSPIENIKQFADDNEESSAIGYFKYLGSLGDALYADTDNKIISERSYNSLATIARNLRDRKIKRLRIKQGVVVEEKDVYGKKFRIEFLGPFENATEVRNRSGVFKLEYGDFSVLFTGGITTEAEEQLINKYGEKLKSDVLVIPNHGLSHSARNPDFYSAVKPKYAIFQAGSYKAPYGNTAESRKLSNELYEEYDETRAFYAEKFGSESNIKDPSGWHDWAVIVKSDGEKYEVKTYKDKSEDVKSVEEQEEGLMDEML